MIDLNKFFIHIHGNIPKYLYNRLIEMNPRVKEEDRMIREHAMKKICDIKSEEEMEAILEKIKPLLRNKKRCILIMGGEYESIIK